MFSAKGHTEWDCRPEAGKDQGGQRTLEKQDLAVNPLTSERAHAIMWLSH